VPVAHACNWILATQEAEIRMIVVQSRAGQIVFENQSQKTHHTHTQRTGGADQGVGSEFKTQYHKKKSLRPA
jgi:hypothetical protein